MKKTFSLKVVWTLCLLLIPLLPSLLIYGITKKRLQYWSTINAHTSEVGAWVTKDNLKKKKNENLAMQSRHADPLYLTKTMPKLKLCQKEVQHLQSLLVAPDFISDITLENRLKFLIRKNIFRFQLKDSSSRDVQIFQSNVLEMDESDIVHTLKILDIPGNDKPLFFVSKWNMTRKSHETGNENWEIYVEVIQREVGI